MAASFVFESKFLGAVFGYLKHFQTAINMNVSEEGIVLSTFDSAHVCMIEMRINSGGCCEAKWDSSGGGADSFVVGASVPHWCKCLDSSANFPHVRIGFDQSAMESKLDFGRYVRSSSLETPGGGEFECSREFTIKSISVNGDAVGPSDREPWISVEMDSAALRLEVVTCLKHQCDPLTFSFETKSASECKRSRRVGKKGKAKGGDEEEEAAAAEEDDDDEDRAILNGSNAPKSAAKKERIVPVMMYVKATNAPEGISIRAPFPVVMERQWAGGLSHSIVPGWKSGMRIGDSEMNGSRGESESGVPDAMVSGMDDVEDGASFGEEDRQTAYDEDGYEIQRREPPRKKSKAAASGAVVARGAGPNKSKSPLHRHVSVVASRGDGAPAEVAFSTKYLNNVTAAVAFSRTVRLDFYESEPHSKVVGFLGVTYESGALGYMRCFLASKIVHDD